MLLGCLRWNLLLCRRGQVRMLLEGTRARPVSLLRHRPGWLIRLGRKQAGPVARHRTLLSQLLGVWLLPDHHQYLEGHCLPSKGPGHGHNLINQMACRRGTPGRNDPIPYFFFFFISLMFSFSFVVTFPYVYVFNLFQARGHWPDRTCV